MLTNIFSNFTMLFTLLILARGTSGLIADILNFHQQLIMPPRTPVESHCIEPVIREGKAEGAHAIGLEYAMKGEYEPAAAHFRYQCFGNYA